MDTLCEDLHKFMIITCWILLEWKMFHMKHILCSINFFQNNAVYEIMCKNMVEPDGPHMIIWHRKDLICMMDNEGKNTDTLS